MLKLVWSSGLATVLCLWGSYQIALSQIVGSPDGKLALFAKVSNSAADLQIQEVIVEPERPVSGANWVDRQSSAEIDTIKRAIGDSIESLEQMPTRLEISLSRRRVTLFMEGIRSESYPVAIGRAGWRTPTGKFKVQQMIKNPDWIHPLTNERIRGGDPNNPLGAYWIGFWTDGKNWIGFHGTPNPESVGQAVSHGCVRMYNKDIAKLFAKVQLGMPVIVKP